MRVRAGWTMLAILAGLPAFGEADSIEWAVGHSYSSASALRQPATFVLVIEEGRPALTQMAGGILARGSQGRSTAWEAGMRANAGSARRSAARSYGALLRAIRAAHPWILALAGEYEADGRFDVEKGIATLEITPMRGAPGLGRWWSDRFRLRWRPWIGAGYGNVFDESDTRADLERDGFWRGYARLEVAFEPRGGATADVEATSWLVNGDVRGTSFVKAAVTVPLGGGLSVACDLEAGRPPPRFERTRRVGLGLGYRRGFRSD